MKQEIKYIKLPEVRRITSLSTTTIYKMANKGEFPKQVSLGARSVAWLLEEVQEWARMKAAARDQER